MISSEAKAVVGEVEGQCRTLYDIAKVAGRNKKSLVGLNPYAGRFCEAVIALSRSEAKLRPVLAAAGFLGDVSGRLSGFLDTLKSPDANDRQRSETLKQVRMICQTTILPAIEAMEVDPQAGTEPVIALDLVRQTRGYLEKLAIQANGCYENRYFDACCVMIRKLVETLVIEVYEAKGKTANIVDGSGNFLMLQDLVCRILSEPSWKLGRDTKRVLPSIKSLGDRSAHTRRYNAVRKDVDDVIPGLRMVVEELLHLANLR